MCGTLSCLGKGTWRVWFDSDRILCLWFQLKTVETLLGNTAKVGEVIVLGMITQLKEVSSFLLWSHWSLLIQCCNTFKMRELQCLTPSVCVENVFLCLPTMKFLCQQPEAGRIFWHVLSWEAGASSDWVWTCQCPELWFWEGSTSNPNCSSSQGSSEIHLL